MTRETRKPNVRWRRLRRKVGTADDPDWIGLALDPNTLIVTVGGTTSNGVYSIGFTPDGLATATASFDRQAAETDAQIATELAAEIQALIDDGTLSPYAVSAVAVSTAVRVVMNHQSLLPVSISVVDPGTATLTVSPDDVWPVAKAQVHSRGADRSVTVLDVAFVPVSTGGAPLPNDNGMVFDVRFIDTIVRATHDDQDLGVGVVASEATVGHDVNTKLPVGLSGSERFGLQISNIATEPTNYSALEVWVKESDA